MFFCECHAPHLAAKPDVLIRKSRGEFSSVGNWDCKGLRSASCPLASAQAEKKGYDTSGMSLPAGTPALTSRLHHTPGVWSWATLRIYLHLIFLICKMGIKVIILPEESDDD